jgi:hypothetical protein
MKSGMANGTSTGLNRTFISVTFTTQREIYGLRPFTDRKMAC